MSLDPRPELVNDHRYWEGLLALAGSADWTDPRGLYPMLLGLRAEGARLGLGGPVGLRLEQGDWGVETTEPRETDRAYQELLDRWLRAPDRAPQVAALRGYLALTLAWVERGPTDG